MANKSISRRVVLAGLAAGAVTSVEHARANEANSETIDVGVITEPGGGHTSSLVRGLAMSRAVGKVAIADASQQSFESARTLLGERLGPTYRDHEELLEKFKPGLTIVTLEAHRSPPAIVAALRAGSHVITDKPSCVRIEDFEQLVALADQQKLHLMMALVTRSSPAMKKARELIQQGFLGQPYATTLDWIADQTRLKSREYQKTWLSFKDKAGGGKLIYHGIHYLDIIQFLVGDRIRQVAGFCENVGGQPIEVEDAAVLSFRFHNGMVGTLNTGYYLDQGTQGKQNQVRVWGSQGWIHAELTKKEPMEWHSTHMSAPQGVQQFPFSDDPGLYELFAQEAVEASLGRAAPPITGQEALDVLKVIFAAYRAAETGKTQTIG